MGLVKVKVNNFNPTPRFDNYSLSLARVIFAWFLFYLIAAATILFFAAKAEAQNTMAPFRTQQVNTSYYVGQGSFTTIQKAVTAACAATAGGRVTIQAGIAPPDTIAAVTGGCTKAPIIDQRAVPDACFTWSGSAYTSTACGSGGGGSAPAGTFNDVQIYGSSTSLAADTGNLQNNSTTHNFHQKQLNGIPYVGNYANMADAFASIGGTGVVIKNAESSDGAAWGGSLTTVFDMKNGSLGTRMHNCTPSAFFLFNAGGIQPCISDFSDFDTPTTGSTFKGTTSLITGPGLDNGNCCDPADQGWLGDMAQWYQVEAYRDGISNVIAIQGTKRSLGDFQGIESRVWTFGGNTDTSGEALVNVGLQGGQRAFYGTGVIASTTGTGDVTPVISAGAQPINSGSYLVDVQAAVASGTLTAPGSAAWSESSYLHTLTTAGGLTQSTASCVSLDVVHLPPTLGTPRSVTFRCTVGALGQIHTGKAFFTSPHSNAEMITITSAPAPVSGVQTITAVSQLNHDVGSNLIQGGTHGCASWDANLSINGWRSTYQVFGATDSTHMIYGYLVLGNSSLQLPMDGNEPETLTAPNNGFHIYPCAQVAYVDPGSLGINFHLLQNDVPWTAGDAWEQPPNPAVNMHTLGVDVQAMSPVNGSGSSSIEVSMVGPGVTGNYAPFTMRNFQPDSMYRGHGGWALAPTMMTFFGPYNQGLFFDEAPENGSALITVNGLGGAGQYALATTSAGSINVSTNLYTFTQALTVAGHLTAAPGSQIASTTFQNNQMLLAGPQVFGADIPAFRINHPLSPNGHGPTIDWYDTDNSVESGAIGSTFSFGSISNIYLTVGSAAHRPFEASWVSGNIDTTLYDHVHIPLTLDTASASVLTSSTINDLAIFDNATGHLADSSVAIGTIPRLASSNTWTGPNQFQNTTSFDALLQVNAGTNATSGANVNPPNLQQAGQYWNGSTSQSDNWFWTETLGTGTNPTSTYALNHSGSTGALAVLFPMLATTVYTVATLPAAATLHSGTQVTVSDCTTFTPGALCTGGGSDYMIAVTNGTVWTVH